MNGIQPLQPKQVVAIRCFEGRRVHLALTDGSRLDDCHLVSAGRPGVRSLWVFHNGADVFVPLRDVADIWEASPTARRAA